MEFVATPITRRMEITLACCRSHGSMGAIVGDTGRGKSLTCLRWVARQRKETAFYLQVPEGCSRGRLASLLCHALGIQTAALNEPEREAALFEILKSRHLIVVDEAGYLIRPKRRNEPIRLLQDLHDICHVPICTIWRYPHWLEFTAGVNAKEDAQLLGRMVYRTVIESGSWYAEEITAICEHFSGVIDKPVMDRAKRIVKSGESGLRTLVSDLMLARDYSRDKAIPFEDAFRNSESYRSQGGDYSGLTRI
jgi:hypothetical protein